MRYPVYFEGTIEVSPPLTEEHARLVEAVVNFEETELTKPVFDAIRASPAPDLPYHDRQLYVSEDKTKLCPEEGESRHGLRLWLDQLLTHVFIPDGYVLNGEMSWTASDDAYDRGYIYVRNNQHEDVDDVIVQPGPSWAPNYYADEHLKQALGALLDSADDTGCSDDLVVVASEPLNKLRAIMQKMS
ncbi:MAG: hypothetical protein BGO25_10355 [Acidobacteriales bacterium 59-55]|nr:hypothetical protein [Terriglobales bacterium]OJV43585.1 MAG: hypothetical protein BGO25_10355 [Acidobacteriales bacterium 59-55]